MTKDIKIKSVRKKIASLDKRKARGGWFFVLPFVIGFALIYLPIVVDSIYYTFCNIQVGGSATFAKGSMFANYKTVFTGSDFVETLIKGLSNMLFEIPMILMFSLFMAVLLNQKMAGRAAFRAIFFIPVILSTGIMEVIGRSDILLETMEGAEGGMESGAAEESASNQIVSSMDVENLFAKMSVGQGLVEYVTQAINNIYDIANRSGVQMLIFLSGLQSISPAIYESVQIDGASAWETFWKITFPMISPMILVNAIYTIIDSFTAGSNVVMRYIDTYKESASELNAEVVASAMAWVYFLIVLAIVGIVAAIFSAFVFYQRKD